MKNNKKGMMTEFLLRLILAILFLGSAIAFGKSMFRITGQAEQSFNNLYRIINELEEGEILSMDLIMDQKTALMGFTKDSEYIQDAKFIKRGSKIIPSYKQHVWKPDQCENDKACLCLCRSTFKKLSTKEEDSPHNLPLEYGCDKITCKSVESLNFLEKIKSEEFGAYYGSTLNLNVKNLEDLYELNGGFVFVRTKDTKITFPGWSTRNNQVYVQRYKTKVAVCFKSPCISDEMINERTGITIGEFEEKGDFMFTPKWMIGVDYLPDEKNHTDTFYYIEDITKDFIGNYYYQYKFGNSPDSAPEQAGFLNIPQEKTKQEFESRFINYAKEGKLVEIDYDNDKIDIKSFEAETKMDKEGKIIDTESVI